MVAVLLPAVLMAMPMTMGLRNGKRGQQASDKNS